MKELSIEEKAQRYDEAKARMSKAYNSNRCTIGFMNEIFPELKESEDERIRKEIIDFATKANNGVTSILANNYNFNKWIDWLEKQAEQKQELLTKEKALKNSPFVEQKPAEVRITGYWNVQDIEQKPNYCHHEVDLSECSEEYRKAYYDGWNNCNQQHAQLKAEQKLAWSEEDDAVLNALIRRLEGEDVYVSPHLAVECLKSLRPQSQWKPSDEQMQAIQVFLEHGCAAPDREASLAEKVLESLYQDLKKLMEE